MTDEETGGGASSLSFLTLPAMVVEHQTQVYSFVVRPGTQGSAAGDVELPSSGAVARWGRRPRGMFIHPLRRDKAPDPTVELWSAPLRRSLTYRKVYNIIIMLI